MEVTHRYPSWRYRIIPVRITKKAGVLETAYSVQFNRLIFGIIDKWETKDTYTDVEDAKKHVKHITGEDT